MVFDVEYIRQAENEKKDRKDCSKGGNFPKEVSNQVNGWVY